MDPKTAILVTLVAYKLILLAIGFIAQRMTADREDLYLGGRRMGPLVAAISASASSSSVWTLLGVSGMAFTFGLSALWLFPACVGGFVINWVFLAPRLRRHSVATNALTLTEVLAGPPDRPGRQKVVVLASVITLFCLLTYVAAQFNGASKSFESTLEIKPVPAILLGGVIVAIYMMLGGFWAVSLTDTLQGLVMALTAIVLPIAAIIEVGGFGALSGRLAALNLDPEYMSTTQGHAGIAALGFVLGLVGLTPGYPGQPHVVNRFMALRDEAAMRRARVYALVWAVLVYSGMIVLGLCGRVLLEATPNDNEQMFFAISQQLFHPLLTGVMLAAVLSAIMSTADSQLLVAASTINYDLGFARRQKDTKSILRDRLVILALSAGAILAAIYGERKIFDQVLFAWTGMGAAFAPLLLWLLWRGPVSSGVAFATMATGFVTSVVAHVGRKLDWWDWFFFESRFLPYLFALAVLIAAGSSSRASDPDTAT